MSNDLSPEIITHIKENLNLRIGHAVFANRLSEKFGEVVTAEQVAHTKDRLKAENAEKPKPGKSFATAAKRTAQKTTPSRNKDPDFVFQRAIVKQPEVSKPYFVRDVGLVEYWGAEDTKVLGVNMRTHVFVSATYEDRVKRLIPDHKMKDMRFMALAAPADFKKVFEKLENGTCHIKLPKRGPHKPDADVKADWDRLLLSGDLGILANIVCARFRDGRDENPLKMAADKALALLSNEYALVTGDVPSNTLKKFYAVSGRDDKMAEIEATYRSYRRKPVPSNE